MTTHARRTAIVTGAARGIGAAVAERLGRDGFAVGAVDLTESADTVAAIDAAELGPPTVVVKNAGIGPRTKLVDMPTEQWDVVFGVNLRGPFFVTRAATPFTQEARWGRIVNLSSISAAGDADRVDYGGAKAGLIGFTTSLALQLGRHGVTANAIAPGFVESDMTRTSARRLGLDFEDIAHAASFLVSPEAGFVSGQVVCVAGGPVAG